MVTISGLLVALIRIMCTALPSTSAKLVLDGKIVNRQSPGYLDVKLADNSNLPANFVLVVTL